MANLNSLQDTQPDTIQGTLSLANKGLKAASLNKQTNFFQQFKQFSIVRIRRLKKTILGDYSYKPKNTFNLHYKQKTFKYLQAKYMTTLAQLQDEKVKKFTNFDPNFGQNVQFKSLKHMKQVFLKLKTHIQAAEDSINQSQISLQQVKGDFFNQVAYQFDRQRKCSAGWGLLLSSVICATIYRRGSFARKAALFLLGGHAFNQIAYHWNVDKYFDTIYPMFQQDALKYIQYEQKQKIIQQLKNPKGPTVLQG